MAAFCALWDLSNKICSVQTPVGQQIRLMYPRCGAQTQVVPCVADWPIAAPLAGQTNQWKDENPTQKYSNPPPPANGLLPSHCNDLHLLPCLPSSSVRVRIALISPAVLRSPPGFIQVSLQWPPKVSPPHLSLSYSRLQCRLLSCWRSTHVSVPLQVLSSLVSPWQKLLLRN